MSVPSITRLNQIFEETVAAARPATCLERVFTEQIAYAAWELERVRANRANVAAESSLTAAYARAGRNWNRARKELTAVQSARSSHAVRLPARLASVAAAHPLAIARSAPSPRPSARVGAEFAEAVDRQAAAECARLRAGLSAAPKGEK